MNGNRIENKEPYDGSKDPWRRLAQRKLTRRKFVALGAGVTSAILLSACGDTSLEPTTTPTIAPKSEVAKTPLVFVTSEPKVRSTMSKESFLALDPIAKLNALEFKQYAPPTRGELEQDVLEASALAYCMQTLCNTPAKEIQAKVKVVDSATLLKMYQDNSDHKLRPVEIERVQNIVEFVPSSGETIVSRDLLERQIKLNEEALSPSSGFPDMNIRALYMRSLYFHAFSHVNYPTQATEQIPHPFKVQDVQFTQRNGFTLIGSDGVNKRYLTGFNEAATELTGRSLSPQAPDKFHYVINLSSLYSDGMDILSDINHQAGVSRQDFLDVSNGKTPTDTYIAKLKKILKADPDISVESNIMVPISLVVSGSMSKADAILHIGQSLKLP